MKDVKYPFSSVYIEPPEELSNRLIDWTRDQISDDDIYVKPSSAAYGREDEMHITLLYGLENPTVEQIGHIFKDIRSIPVTLGKLYLFEKPDFDVLYATILYQPHLKTYNKSLKQLPHIEKHNVYVPHMTLGYLKKGRSNKFRYRRDWNHTFFSNNYVVLSTKDGIKEKIFFREP